MPGIVFHNPHSGRHHISIDDLRAHFRGHRVEETSPAGFADAVKRAIDQPAEPGGPVDFIGLAGGDGTIRGGAQPLLDRPMPLLAVPAGTRNHFAHQLGIHDLSDAARATTGTVELIDVGEVNGRCFVNNSAIGLYPELVTRREAYQKRGLPKRMAQAFADIVELTRAHRFDVSVNRVPYRAWLVFVGNGHYGEDVFDLAARDTLNQHVLDVRIIRGDRFLARLRLLAAVALGRLHRSPLLVQELSSEVRVDLIADTVDVALDGEVQTLSPPLQYRTRPAALRVLVPSDPGDVRPHVLRYPQPERD